MRRIISFCLWGSNPKYTVGALKNAVLARTVYPGWEPLFYVCMDSVPADIVAELRRLGASIVEKHRGNWTSMFWRFAPCMGQDIDCMISRDTDSRLGPREKAAVDEWLASGLDFHIMRDHPEHNVPILGGMWGIRGNRLDIPELIRQWECHDCWQTDQTFLTAKVWPKVKDRVMIHDEIHGHRSFPVPRKGYSFVGEIFDAEDRPVQAHRQELRRFLEKHPERNG